MDISKSSVAIATHYRVYGAPQALREYLIDRNIKELFFIGHPLHIDDDKSYIELIRNAESIFKKNVGFRSPFPLLNYIIETALTIKHVICSRTKFHLFVGVDSLNAFTGILLRRLGRAKRVVFYTIDYVPNRFPNRFLNRIYHCLDKFCVSHADETWNVSPRIAEAREQLRGMKQSIYNRQKVVPIGVWPDRIKNVPFEQIKKHQLLFVGNLLEKQGVQHVLMAIPEIIKQIPDFTFLIVGGGDHSAALRELASELEIEAHVTFTGWIKDRSKLDTVMSDSALAVALYDQSKDTFTYYADPTKLKDYLSAGLYILLTDVPHNARDIEANGCGKIITAQPSSISKAVIEALRDEHTLKEGRKSALNYIKKFRWMNIFDDIFLSMNIDKGADRS